jgi:hypothetical protein
MCDETTKKDALTGGMSGMTNGKSIVTGTNYAMIGTNTTMPQPEMTGATCITIIGT